MKIKNVYKTYDLACAAALISEGFILLTLDKENPRKVQFVFNESNHIVEVIDKYWSDKLKVNARTFFDNIKMLKNRIYSDD